MNTLFGNNKLVIPDLSFSVGTFDFTLPLRAPRVLVRGDSGTGKTFLYNLLDNIPIDNDISPELGKLKSKLVLVNYTMSESNLIILLRANTDKLFIIDNADITIDGSEALEALDKSKNQFILFGRDERKFMVPRENAACLQRTGTKFCLDYME